MFLLHNLRQKKPLKVTKIYNRYNLLLETDFYKQEGTEKPHQDSLYICESESQDSLSNISNPVKCGYYELLTRMRITNTDDSAIFSYEELQKRHGSKITRRALKTKQNVDSELNIDQITISPFEETIVPKHNQNAKEPKDIYTLSVMFDTLLLNKINDYEFHEQNLKIPNFEYKPHLKASFIILDTILYSLKRKYIPDKLPHDDISYDILDQILSQKEDARPVEKNKVRNYNTSERVKLIAMACIMILRIRKYRANLLELPDFQTGKDIEIEKIFKLLGCKIENNIAILVKVPENKRRIKRN